MLKLDVLRTTPIERDPFEYVIVKDFIEREKLKEVLADYPEVPGPGSHPPSGLKIAGRFKDLMDEMLGASFRHEIEEKSRMDLIAQQQAAERQRQEDEQKLQQAIEAEKARKNFDEEIWHGVTMQIIDEPTLDRMHVHPSDKADDLLIRQMVRE